VSTLPLCLSEVAPFHNSGKLTTLNPGTAAVASAGVITAALVPVLSLKIEVRTQPLLLSCMSPRWPSVNVGGVRLYFPPTFIGAALSAAPDATLPIAIKLASEAGAILKLAALVFIPSEAGNLADIAAERTYPPFSKPMVVPAAAPVTSE